MFQARVILSVKVHCQNSGDRKRFHDVLVDHEWRLYGMTEHAWDFYTDVEAESDEEILESGNLHLTDASLAAGSATYSAEFLILTHDGPEFADSEEHNSASGEFLSDEEI